MHQRFAQAYRPIESVGILMGPPSLFLALLIDHHRCVQNHAGRGESLVEGCGINEGFETRSRLAPGLGHAVEFALKKTKPPTRAATAPSLGSTDTSALCACGTCTNRRESAVIPTV